MTLQMIGIGQSEVEMSVEWWVQVIWVPVIGGMIGFIMKVKGDGERRSEANTASIDRLRAELAEQISRQKDEINETRLHMAQNYVPVQTLRDVEKRLTDHLVRIEKTLASIKNG